MSTYAVWVKTISKTYLGPFEANSEAAAIEKADIYRATWPSLSSEAEVLDEELIAEEE